MTPEHESPPGELANGSEERAAQGAGLPQKPEIVYPAAWGYRIVCTSEEAVRAHVLEILQDLEYELVAGRSSSGGTYTTLNLKLVVQDEAHRLRIYEHLGGHDAIRFVI